MYILLLMVIAALCIRLFLYEKEIKNAVKKLAERNQDKTRQKITTTFLSKNLVNLFVGINSSISKEEQARIDVKNHEEKLKRSIANLSHDLRTPLTSILGYLSMLKADKTKAEEYLEIIEHRAKTLGVLLNEFYELSVYEDEDFAIELERVDIVSILAENLMGNYLLFGEKGITPQINLPDKGVFIMANAGILDRIFQNLLTNALRYSSGDITVALTCSPPHCTLKIANPTGELATEDTDHIFDRFYMADQSRGSGGTGLGLYVVKTLVEKLGGEISAALSGGVFEVTVRLKI